MGPACTVWATGRFLKTPVARPGVGFPDSREEWRFVSRLSLCLRIGRSRSMGILVLLSPAGGDRDHLSLFGPVDPWLSLFTSLSSLPPPSLCLFSTSVSVSPVTSVSLSGTPSPSDHSFSACLCVYLFFLLTAPVMLSLDSW